MTALQLGERRRVGELGKFLFRRREGGSGAGAPYPRS